MWHSLPQVSDRAPIPRWLPNAISAFRVVLVPVWLLIAEGAHAGDASAGALRMKLVAVLLVLGFSDIADGWLARRYRLTSQFGATLDAVADKLAQVAFVTYLVWRTHPHLEALPIWFWAMLVLRDGVIGAGYLTIRAKHGTVDAEHEVHGKVSSVLLFFVVLAAIASVTTWATTVAIWLTAPVVIFSTLAYVRAGWRQLRRPAPTE